MFGKAMHLESRAVNRTASWSFDRSRFPKKAAGFNRGPGNQPGIDGGMPTPLGVWTNSRFLTKSDAADINHPMKNHRAPFGCLVLAAAVASGGTLSRQAAGTTLYSGGDPTAGSYAYNVKSPSADSETELYQEFIVPQGSTWSISTIGLNVVTDGIPANEITQADYEIRKGVSSGNGGTLLYSGTVPIKGVDDGINTGNGEIYLFSGSPSNAPSLTAGTYWLAFVPYSPSNTNLFADGNDGSNTVNKPAAPNDYISGIQNGMSTGSFESYSFSASEELLGTSSVIPEPSTWAAVALGLGALGVFRRVRDRAAGFHAGQEGSGKTRRESVRRRGARGVQPLCG